MSTALALFRRDLRLADNPAWSAAWGGYYPRGDDSLEQAEEATLKLYGERAELADDQHILELGCGWGSLTLWMAERFPSEPAARTHRGEAPKARAAQRARNHSGR